MKKVLFLLLLCMPLLSVAQEGEDKIIDMNRNFNIGGKCILFTKSKNPQPTDKCDYTWELKNSRVASENFVTLKIKDADSHIVEHSSWHDGVNVFMIRTPDKKDNYYVNDDVFSHLRIYEYEDGTYSVHLYSVIIADYQ